MNKEIFLTKCYNCGKRIAILTEKEFHKHNVYDCNDCTPKNSGLRNGIDQSYETDLFDEIDFESNK